MSASLQVAPAVAPTWWFHTEKWGWLDSVVNLTRCGAELRGWRLPRQIGEPSQTIPRKSSSLQVKTRKRSFVLQPKHRTSQCDTERSHRTLHWTSENRARAWENQMAAWVWFNLSSCQSLDLEDNDSVKSRFVAGQGSHGRLHLLWAGLACRTQDALCSRDGRENWQKFKAFFKPRWDDQVWAYSATAKAKLSKSAI